LSGTSIGNSGRILLQRVLVWQTFNRGWKTRAFKTQVFKKLDRVTPMRASRMWDTRCEQVAMAASRTRGEMTNFISTFSRCRNWVNSNREHRRQIIENNAEKGSMGAGFDRFFRFQKRIAVRYVPRLHCQGAGGTVFRKIDRSPTRTLNTTSSSAVWIRKPRLSGHA